MKSFLRHAFGHGPRARLGAGWDGRVLSLARAFQGPDGGRVEAAAPTADALRDPVTAVLPQSLLVVKPLTLPSTDPAELTAMAALQAGRHIPLPPEELLADVSVLDVTEDGGARVLLFAARREDVAEHLSALRARGVRPERLVPAAFALEALLLRAAAAGETLIGVEAYRRAAVFVLFKDGKVRFLRSIPVGMEDLATGAGRERLGRELRDTHLALEGEKRLTDPVRVLAGGAGPEGARLREAVAGALPWRVDPFPTVTDGPPSVEGAALLPPAGAPDLLPAEDRRRSAFWRRGETLSFAGLAAACLIAGGTWGARDVQVKKNRLALLDRQWKAVEADVRELERMERSLARLGRGSGSMSELPELLAALNKRLPPRVSLVALHFERKEEAVLQGTAFSLADAVSAVNALETSRLFHKVTLRSSNVRPLHGQEIAEFQIHLRLSPEEAR